MEICKTEACTGCLACRNICPKDAIEIGHDAYGKTIPKVAQDKCINCGACFRICPVNHPVEKHCAEYSIAAWSCDSQDQQLSSSGGAAAVFSRRIIKDGGVVFGAASLERTVKHIKAESEEELDKLRGSKYVQSDIGFAYMDVKKELLAGRNVLFTGTPCQVAGLKNYLGKGYDNLLTVDLVCHGTPPIQYLKEHISHVAKRKEWDSVSFRGNYDYFLTVYNQGVITYQEKRDCDEYFKAFSEGLTFRDNCYLCSYACPERVSDITIGDFWGLDRKKLKNDYQGRISLVLPNTEKGKRFFEQCQSDFVWEQRDLDEALVPEQGNLLHPSVPHPDREVFCNHYRDKDFCTAIKATRIHRAVLKEQYKGILRKTLMWKLLRKGKRIVKGRS